MDVKLVRKGIDDILDVQISDGMIILMKPFRHKSLEFERNPKQGADC
ncbi:MAG: hypothetical protein SPG09_11150 [Lachnospiraceae bacterium]|nr:hypothetical protein [bacterium]MDY5518149.1 hypothetical protein [Lachnospiraceae bacterium]